MKWIYETWVGRWILLGIYMLVAAAFVILSYLVSPKLADIVAGGLFIFAGFSAIIMAIAADVS